MRLHRLCEITGDPHPDYLMPKLTAKQLNDWQQYEKQCGYRDDILWGMLMALIANVNRSKDADVLQAEDFMPYYDKPIPEPEETADKVKNMFARMKGTPTGDK